MGHIRSAMTQNQPDIPIPDDVEKCSICLEELETCRAGFKNVVFTHCGHPFHPNCIGRLQSSECPVCRQSLSEAQIVNLREAAQNAAIVEDEIDDWQNGNAALQF